MPNFAHAPLERRKRILEAKSLDHLLDQADGAAVLQAEADDPDESHRLITQEQLDYLLALRKERGRAKSKLQFFFSTDDVIMVPGFMGSSLEDVHGPHGLIWIDPTLVFDRKAEQLGALKLGAFDKDQPETDADPRVRIDSLRPLPAIYDVMALDLEMRRYSVTMFPFDWRKDLEGAAQVLAEKIRSRLGQKLRPLHVIAHSQGSLVARRAIQMLGTEAARRLINNLVLLGPASFGSFSAAFALSGDHESIETIRKFGVKIPDDFHVVLQSFTGLYQLLPWDASKFDNGFDPGVLGKKASWELGVDQARLEYGFGWGAQIDTSFFNDRTTIILGGKEMVGAVRFDGGHVVADGELVSGDGTVTDQNALLPGVRAYKVEGAEHGNLPLNLTVQSAVRAILRGETPRLARFALVGAAGVPVLTPLARRPASRVRRQAPTAAPTSGRPHPPEPRCRRLRVFSFDPLLAMNLDSLEIATITLELPWGSDGKFGPGPVGEYIEVIDYDPASQRFYHPVDLSHPRLAAQDGLTPSESNPQFHQQMVYAVAMSTIVTFERALGRAALWAPRFERDAQGKVVGTGEDDGFVPRLRIYPHALREANAFYDPDRHALLFGYFPSREKPGGETLPGGVVFTCQSFDIIAHETTHALLHGLHRYYLYPSNPDTLAFHEAFADAVALFQNFSHKEVLVHQIARTRGDLRKDNLLGQLARQFGQALGEHRGALRRYINVQPDPSLYASTAEPHDRGAILMAALFRAFLNIYEHRSRDLYRIASRGTGRIPDGDIHPDLVNRLAGEASKSAEHLLTMCVRALDYVPPVDLTFGEYLRALITADFELVRHDDRGYRVSVLDAFRAWGLYPADVNVLDEAAVLWNAPQSWNPDALSDVIRQLTFSNWTSRPDRRQLYLEMRENNKVFRSLLFRVAEEWGDEGAAFGVLVLGDRYQSIARNEWGKPKFEVHSVRPCVRLGPDGEPLNDLVVEVVQKRAGYFSHDQQSKVDSGAAPIGKPDFWFRGGCTLIIDPIAGSVRYCIRKSILNDERLQRQREFEQTGGHFSLAATYFGTQGRNPFALLHGAEGE